MRRIENDLVKNMFGTWKKRNETKAIRDISKMDGLNRKRALNARQKIDFFDKRLRKNRDLILWAQLMEVI
ncbi:hypothetical protein BpHYR1_002366 [Brachionus plicatilis]|uniref:Uncharacterized protein n=1 Tax=Brachionus plicatilis TaxID=10195 RepID=A0A3M7QK76_BRAPC|nr:hypothetical protein BpHYR1_002366 [Brachionus plicatilis]